MNVFILTDLEGIPGVTGIDCVDKTHPAYEEACRLLEKAINRSAALCRKYGAETVYYMDGHAGGGNVREENIDPLLIKADIVLWQKLLAEGKIDCQIELGAHARAGTLGGFLDHTINSRQWFSHSINGRESSELSLHALVCGLYGVPVVCCIGDEAACEQAKEYLPDISTAAIKAAHCRNECTCAPDADERMEKAIKEALAHYGSAQIYTVSLPADVRLTFYRTDFCEAALMRDPSAERIDARTLGRRLNVISGYNDLKF